MSGQRVLCYAPYNRWALHGLWEMTILQGLRLRGAEFRYVMCDGMYTDCDVYWEATTGPRPQNACAGCQADQARLAASMGMDFEWLGRYLTVEERAAARSWTDSLADEEVPQATYGDWPVAEWTRSSVQSHFRSSRLDPTSPAVLRTLRSYLYSGLTACFALSRLLDVSDPEVLLLFNGRVSSTRVAFELARQRNIRVLTHERGPRDETLELNENVYTTSLVPINQYWQQWGGVPLRRDELAKISRLLTDREHGVNTGWTAYTTGPQKADGVIRSLALQGKRPVWVLFTSSDDEVTGNEEWGSPFASQLDWIQRTIDYAREHPEIDLIIRVHPNTGSRRSNGANRVQLEEMRGLVPGLPANVRLIDPDDELSSYTLMDLCVVGLVWVSTVAVELAAKGKEVLVAAGNYVSGKPFAHTVNDADRYEEMLDGLIATEPDGRSTETRRLALRLAYGLFFRTRIDFPLVKMPNAHEGVLAYKSLEALLPGRDAGVDRCARIVLDEEPVCPPPGVEELARDTADEDAFLRGFAVPTVSVPGTTDESEPEPIWELRARTNTSSTTPRVSVVIPCYNLAPYLPETVASVRAQTLDDIEILIVDDGSSDASVDVAQSLIATHSEADISLWCQRGKGRPSGNPARPRNAGVANARADLVLCLDADDLLTPEFLERCVEALDAHPEAGVAYTDFVQFRPDGHSVNWVPAYDLSVLSHRNQLGIASVFRRRAWEDVGGFDHDIVYEDWDFWIGCGYTGHHPIKVNGVVWLYRESDSGRYASDCIPADRVSKAKIVRKRPALYSDAQRLWADAVLTGARWAQQLETEVGVIPKLGADRAQSLLASAAQQEAGQLRTFTTVAWAAEVVAAPSLLTTYAGLFGPDADATLVLYAPSDQPDGLLENVVTLVKAAGLDGNDGPDLHLLAVPAAEGDQFLRQRATAVLSDRPAAPVFAGLPHVDEAEAGVLTQLAGCA